MIPAPHINEHIKSSLSVAFKTPQPRIARQLQSPYLILEGKHPIIRKEEFEAANLNDELGLLRFPFQTFRFCMANGPVAVFGYCEKQETAINAIFFHRNATGVADIFRKITFHRGDGENCDKIFSSVRFFKTKGCEELTKAKEEYEKLLAKNPKLARDENRDLTAVDAPALIAAGMLLKKQSACLRSSANALEGMMNLFECGPEGFKIEVNGEWEETGFFYGVLAFFSYEYLAPHNFVARVSEKREGKSTEWIKAREHLTVIHRHHSANNAALEIGSCVNESKNSTRLAHSRRAHTKLLSHPRYKFKMGQRIFVRASWVGPKEWKDTAGQTYQILEQVTQP